MNVLAVRGPADAREFVQPLRNDSRVLGVELFGSVARCEAGPRSDVDLLVVHDGPVPDDLADTVPDDVTLAFYTPTRLAALTARSPLFALHLAQEGLPIYDPRGLIARALANARPLESATRSRLVASTALRLNELRAQPRGLALDPRASSVELYALAKQGAMLHRTANGTHEFNRRRALARAYVDVALPMADRERINALEESWLAARARDEDASMSSDDLEAAAAAVQSLLTALRE